MYHLTQISSSAGVGGGEQHLLLLARYLHGSEFHFSFILPEEGPFCDQLHRAKLAYRVVPMGSKLNLNSWFAIKDVLQNNVTDLVHCHGTRANWFGRVAARMARVPITFSTAHGSLKDYPYSAFRRRAYVMLEMQTAHLVAQWIAVSEATRNDLVDYYGVPAHKVEVVRNGVDLRDLRPQRLRSSTRQELGVAPDALVIVQIGRMAAEKGHRFLLEAVSLMTSSFPNLVCLLAGDGPERPRLERQIRELGIEDRVKLLGFRSDVADLLDSSDIYVLPSLSEALPIGLLEAMALNRPVVASAVNGVPEVLEDGVSGRTVPPRDVGALVDALSQLASNPEERGLMAHAAKQTVVDHFTAERTASRVAELYRRHLMPPSKSRTASDGYEL